MKYTPTIGLEIHAELKTKSKMFCSCANDPLEQHPNVNICPICMGHPGTLPVANEDAIKKVIKVGLALNCDIAEQSKFDRKNYFYPDLPKGYQISQYDMPLCQKGTLAVGGKEISITRIHLEEDTGKSLHPKDADYSLLDFNRAGVPLMELVTEPDIASAQEARQFAQELQLILRYLDVSDADMEKGQMRVEVNISLRPNDQVPISNFQSPKESKLPTGQANPNDQNSKQQKLGTKVEIKNLNSFRVVEQAIHFEIKRQTEILEKGEKVVQETRGWNEAKQETFSQREKESAHDYRYFPEPDLPPFTFSEDDIQQIRLQLPELPQARRQRFQREYDLSREQIEFFARNKDMGEYFEKVVSELGPNIPDVKLQKLTALSANYIISDLMGLLEGASVEGEDFLITPENFAELITMIYERKISTPAAKSVLKEMFAKGGDPSQIIESRGLAQQYDRAELEKIAKQITEKNPKAVEDYKSGKENALQFLVGQMMAATKSAINPETAREALLKILS